MPNTLPYAGLLSEIEQIPSSQNRYTPDYGVSARFKTWINNETRLNATNMNELVGFIQTYSQQIGDAVDEFISGSLENLIELNAGWKVSPDTISNENRTVVGGELFNDYLNNVASGQYSHAGGTNTQALGDISFVFGEGLIAANRNQFIIGKYNDNKSNTIFEIGNGTSETKSNVFEVHNDGSVVGGLEDLQDESSDLTLTPKGYVDKKEEALQQQIDLLEQLNEWLGSITLTSEQMDLWNNRFNTETQQYTEFENLLTQWVLDNEVDETGQPRNPRNGDQLTVIPDEGGLTTDDIPYPELWMFVENDNDPQTTDGTWKFFSSLQQIRNASKQIKGLVQIGDNINVTDGLISVPQATSDTLGVVKLGNNIVNDEDNNLILSWSKW